MKNELRIGNYINNSNKVLSITDSGILCTGLSMTGVVLIEIPKPIPLTEEWLLKFGFEYKSYGYGEKEWKQWNYKGFNLNGFEYSSYLKIDYLHQLQNLYFALTNEELTIKE